MLGPLIECIITILPHRQAEGNPIYIKKERAPKKEPALYRVNCLMIENQLFDRDRPPFYLFPFGHGQAKNTIIVAGLYLVAFDLAVEPE